MSACTLKTLKDNLESLRNLFFGVRRRATGDPVLIISCGIGGDSVFNFGKEVDQETFISSFLSSNEYSVPDRREEIN